MSRDAFQRRSWDRDNKLHLWLAVAAVVSLVPGISLASPQVTAVHVVSRVGDAPTADDQAKRVRRDQDVTLYAVVETTEGGERRWYSDAPDVRLGKRRPKLLPLKDAPAHTLSWWKVEPITDNLSNTISGSFRFERIEYQATPVSSALGAGQWVADVRPTLTPDRGKGLGTMRFQVRATVGDEVVSSPGPELPRQRGAGGLDDRVHRVSVRQDDTYLGFLTELYGQPYIWASAGVTDRRHQAERLEGADCADFVTYGWRRLGHAVAYTWSEGLRDQTRRLGGGEPDAEGVYRDPRGQAVPFPAPGDLILFPRHVGVLVADRGEPGVLDTADLMFHTLFKSPEMEEIRATAYGTSRAEVLRWRNR